jgi:hypothetical protein
MRLNAATLDVDLWGLVAAKMVGPVIGPRLPCERFFLHVRLAQSDPVS